MNLLPFEDFFTYLKQQGFALGVSDFLQVQSLLNRLPEDCPPERLKRLLCPLVASNQEEQTFFYEAFDRYFADMALENKTIPNRNTQTVKETASPSSDFEVNEWEEKDDAYFQKYGEKTTFTFWGFITSRLTWIGSFLLVMLILLFVGIKQNATQIQEVTPNYTHTSPQIPNDQIPVPSPKIPSYHTQTANYWWWIWGILLAGGAILLYRLYKAEREEFYLEAQSRLKPPKYWNIQVPKSELKFNRSSVFKQASQELQQRRKIATHKIDIPKTLTATIESAGYPNFRYLEQSELPEYLMLLPESLDKNQQVQLFEAWHQALKEQEVWVHRFFYPANQPQKCTDEAGNTFHIKELYAKYGDCRLLAFVDLENLMEQTDTGTGTNAIQFWGDWQEKALLNTRIPSKKAQEIATQNDFLLLPASLQSLVQINSLFAGASSTPSFPFAANPISNTWQGLSIAETVKELKRRLNKVSFQWLCATAFYPEMNWDLTVFIGETLFDERELVKEENVLPLVNLPWFKKGFIPDGLRMALMAQLDKDRARLVREAILHLLQLNPLVGEEYSQDFFDYQLHIALEDAQLHPEDQYKLSTLKDLAARTEFANSRYQEVVLRYFKAEKKDANKVLQLGKAFKKKFKRKDIAAEGVITSRTTEKIQYIYPKAHLGGRFAAAFVDMVFTFFILFMVGCCSLIFMDVWELSMIPFGFALWMYLSIDSWSEGSGFGKYSVYRVIDIRTNKPCRFWQSAVRRSFLFVSMILLGVLMAMGNEHFDLNLNDDSDGFFWLLVLYFLQLVFNPQGRKMGDYLAHTQVVSEEDYQAGNFEVRKILKPETTR